MIWSGSSFVLKVMVWGVVLKDTVCVELLNNMLVCPLLKKAVSDFQEFGS